MSKVTIDRYPGTIFSAVACLNHEWLKEYLDGFVKNHKSFNTDEESQLYNSFLTEYLINYSNLVDIPDILGLKESTCSSWASDIIGTVQGAYREYLFSKSYEDDDECSTEIKKEETPKTLNPAITELVEAYGNADYYDMNTGRTYHIQEYNRMKSFGFPTQGIKVSEDGRVIGYVPEYK